MRHSATIPDVFLYCHRSKSLSLGVARALQGLVCASPAQWPRINAAFAPVTLPAQWADLGGRHGGLSLLRLLNERPGPQRFNLVGHSSGCRIMCSALQALAQDAQMLARLAGSEFNVALVQPAADSEPLAAGQSGIPRLRMLIATSDRDNLEVPGDQRFDVTNTVVPTFTARLAVADLTPLHDAGGEFDINRSQVYELLARFFGHEGVSAPPPSSPEPHLNRREP
jgi:hypothetical protein